MKKRPIFILTGAPGSGKTTVSKALLKRFSHGVHVQVDDLRGKVVSGLSNPIGSWDDETDRQFRLARDSAAQIAKVYAQGGFAVTVDDVIFPDAIEHHFETVLSDFELHKVLLRPTIANNVVRNRERKIEVDNAQLEQIIRPIYDHFATFSLAKLEQQGWRIIDSSNLSVEETVSEILARSGCFPKQDEQ